MISEILRYRQTDIHKNIDPVDLMKGQYLLFMLRYHGQNFPRFLGYSLF